jgi:2-octaprenyl-6-methoxyphenol hydroxylase
MSARIVVVGGGPVGLAFAIAASRIPGLLVEIVERSAETWARLPPTVDHRVYALSPASLAFLNGIDVALDESRVAPVRAMQVWGDALDAEDNHLELGNGRPLASIVEHGVLMHALSRRLVADGVVNLHLGNTPTGMGMDGAQRILRLQDGNALSTDLLIAADGRQSRIRDWAGIAVDAKDYESDGIVGNFLCEHFHGDVARQWFTANGVLALLPLPGKHVSMVWSVDRKLSNALPADSGAEVVARIESESRRALGALTIASPVEKFPLARITARKWVEPGLALMGDAAHAVHPLAGQGVNLGFGDAVAMCQIIGRQPRFSGIGDVAMLRRYERSRREAAWAVGEVTDGLHRLYLSESGAASWLRNSGLGIFGRLPAAKAVLIDYAAG